MLLCSICADNTQTFFFAEFDPAWNVDRTWWKTNLTRYMISIVPLMAPIVIGVYAPDVRNNYATGSRNNSLNMIGIMCLWSARCMFSRPLLTEHTATFNARTWRMRGLSRRWTSCWPTTSRCGRSARKVRGVHQYIHLHIWVVVFFFHAAIYTRPSTHTVIVLSCWKIAVILHFPFAHEFFFVF